MRSRAIITGWRCHSWPRWASRTRPLGEEEAKHSRAIWRAIIRGRRADIERLVEAARLEIWEHITFWDDVYYAILGMENELAS
jgi:hypothetical protein